MNRAIRHWILQLAVILVALEMGILGFALWRSTAPQLKTSPTPSALPTASPGPSPTSRSNPEPFLIGVQVHGYVGDPRDTLRVVRQVGFPWVKQQVLWSMHEPEPGRYDWGILEGFLIVAEREHVNVVLSVVTAPEWSRREGGIRGPPDRPEDLARFLRTLIRRHRGRIHAIEVWNEQNLKREWQTSRGLRPEDYVELLRVAYTTIKAEDPGIMVISGALSPTGIDDGVNAVDDFRYLQGMVQAGFLNYADCVGVHHNGYNIGPDVLAEEAPLLPEARTARFRGPFDNPHHSWSFKSTLWGYREIIRDAKPLCVTEFGWASAEEYGTAPPGFEFALDNSLEKQARWIVEGFERMRNWGFVRMAILWNLDFGPKGFGPKRDDNVLYSILDTRGVPRPAFSALQAYLAGLRTGDR
ncbi:beta-galactosidase [Thermoflexus sp.]|uniref:beta-galactosidase n=1 Tax=Thermoflexus sp. TaxID=1969742 RepID=UPI001772E3B6|nr:beta-galactosidase [Thermoflexus sp.]